jgi:hypothetical protein
MGNMIDQDPLIKILCDPAHLERLMKMKEYGAVKHEQSTTSATVTPIVPQPQLQMAVNALPSSANPMAVPSVSMNDPASSSHGHNFSRGVNYYKTLIHQHGGERQEPLVTFLGVPIVIDLQRRGKLARFFCSCSN